jgi:hypothetical protein
MYLLGARWYSELHSGSTLQWRILISSGQPYRHSVETEHKLSLFCQWQLVPGLSDFSIREDKQNRPPSASSWLTLSPKGRCGKAISTGLCHQVK